MIMSYKMATITAIILTLLLGRQYQVATTAAQPVPASNCPVVLGRHLTNAGLASVRHLLEGAIGVNMYYCVIQSIEDGAFYSVPFLREVILSHNEIESISAKTFSDLRILSRLSLEYNRLSTLPDGAVTFSVNLTRLTLGNNNLQHISNSTFYNLRNLRKLELDANNISEIEAGAFESLVKLQTLDLNENKLQSVIPYNCQSSNNSSLSCSSIFKGLRKLKNLYLMKNKISQIPDGGFRDLVELESLDLSDNKLHVVTSKTFVTLSNCIRLNLSYNQIAYVADGAFSSLCKLVELFVRGNPLRKWSRDYFGCEGSISELSFDDDFIPDLFMNFTGLRELTINKVHTPIIRQGAFRHLPVIHYLDLSNNRVMGIERNAFQGLQPRLNRIDLHNHTIKEIGPSVFNSIGIYYLDLSYGDITFIVDRAFSGMDVTELLLNNNKLTKITSKTFEGFSIRRLRLDNNAISFIEEHAFDGLNYIQTLNLSGNFIRDIPPRLLVNSIYLRYLFLNDNAIEIIKNNSFAGLRMLSELHLQNNDVTFIEEGAFTHFYSDMIDHICLHKNNLQTLPLDLKNGIVMPDVEVSLGFNNFHCNCLMKTTRNNYDDLLSMYKDIRCVGEDTPNKTAYYELRCSSPPAVANQRYANVTLSCSEPSLPEVKITTENEDVVISCSSFGEPSPTLELSSDVTTSNVTWSKTSGNRSTIELRINSEEVIPSEIHCMAKNVAGQKSTSLTTNFSNTETLETTEENNLLNIVAVVLITLSLLLGIIDVYLCRKFNVFRRSDPPGNVIDLRKTGAIVEDNTWFPVS